MAFTWRFGKKSGQTNPIAHAERLVQSKKFLQAIDTLTQANSVDPSPTIEARLIELRHEAFFHQNFSSKFEHWPPAIGNRFASVDNIPEISADQISSEILRDGVFSRGSIIIRGLLGDDDIQKLIDAVATKPN